jgi:hypothetical protein
MNASANFGSEYDNTIKYCERKNLHIGFALIYPDHNHSCKIDNNRHIFLAGTRGSCGKNVSPLLDIVIF